MAGYQDLRSTNIHAIGRTQAKVLANEDEKIVAQNAKLRKVATSVDVASARLANRIQQGADASVIEKATITFEKAKERLDMSVQSSMKLVGTGSGDQGILLPRD